MDHIDNAVQEFLGGNAPSSELRIWREALQQRLTRLRNEAARDPEASEALRLKIEHLEKQVHALMEEEAITGFVEQTVRASAADVSAVSGENKSHGSDIPPWADLDVDDLPEDH